MKKRTLVLVSLILFIPSLIFAAARPNSQKGIYGCSALIGGTQGALDALDQTGDGDTDITDGTPNQYDLIDGDFAIVGTISGSSTSLYFYVYDADGTDAESSPEVIRPDDYGAAGVWILANYYMKGSTQSRSATPQWCFGDSDTTDSDDNVCFTVNCTDTGSGTEDCNLTISVQIAGTLTDVIVIDADGSISFSNLSVALGTPTSGTLTNCTGLPQAGTVGLTTSDSPQFAEVNIGHATDTTLTRVSAGVIAVEGANVQTGTDDDVPESGDFGAGADLEADGSLSDDVIAPAEMANADHGDVSWSSGVATVEGVETNAGDLTLSSGGVGIDTTQGQFGYHDGTREIAIPSIHVAHGRWDLSSYYDYSHYVRLSDLDTERYPDGIVITQWELMCETSADPTTELNANLYYSNDPGSGILPGASPTLIDVIDSTTGNSSEATMSNSDLGSGAIPAGTTMYILLDADPTDADTMWSLKIHYYIPES